MKGPAVAKACQSICMTAFLVLEWQPFLCHLEESSCCQGVPVHLYYSLPNPESTRKRSLLLYLGYVFWVLINSLLCWFLSWRVQLLSRSVSLLVWQPSSLWVLRSGCCHEVSACLHSAIPPSRVKMQSHSFIFCLTQRAGADLHSKYWFTPSFLQPLPYLVTP